MNPTSPPSVVATLLQKYAEGERDFSNINLNECALAGVKLPHIILRGASLKIVNLSTANLSHGDLRQAVLNVSRLSGINLSQAQLQQAQLNVTNLVRAVLVGANLSQASLVRAELLRADLSNANLTGANLQEADLREARLRWVNLSGANLSRCNLRNSSLLGANLSHVQGNAANLEGTRLSGASLMGAELRHANLRGADLSGANLRGANLRWANLSGANLQEADLTDAKLSGADLLSAQLEGATLENTTLVHADLSRTNLQRVRCVGADLSGATLTGAQLYGAIAYDVQTTDIVCDWVDLSPQGDRSQQRYFNTEADVHTFLNQRPPQVKVTVDLAMSAAAHATLAAVYAQLAAVSAVFTQPPNIELTNRRTVLTFFTEDAMTLAAIAYLATWPFEDGKTIETTLTTLMAEAQAAPLRSPGAETGDRALAAATQDLAQTPLTALVEAVAAHPFFAAPIQVKLSNANGRTLDLFRHPRFGIRHLSTADNLFPVESVLPPLPTVTDYLAFLTPP